MKQGGSTVIRSTMLVVVKTYAHRRRRVCAAQIVTRLVCIEQYISTGSKPERCVS